MTTQHHIRFGFIEAAALALAGLTAAPFAINYFDKQAAVRETLTEVRAEQARVKREIELMASKLPKTIDPETAQCEYYTGNFDSQLSNLEHLYRQAVSEESELSEVSEENKAKKLADIHLIVNNTKQQGKLLTDQCFAISLR